MTLACHDHNVTCTCFRKRRGNGGAPVTDFERVGAGSPNGRADCCRIFVAGVVIRNDGQICQIGCNLTHERPFAAITVPPCTEDHDQPVLRMGPQAVEQMLKGVGGMSVIDIDAGA